VDYAQQEVAQMIRRMLPLVVLCLAATLTSRSGFAQNTAADDAIAAESQGRFEEAARLYRTALAADPGRSDRWIRLADVEAKLGNLDQCVDALQHAAKAAPASVSTYVRLSQAYATANMPRPALEAIEAAFVLNPSAPDVLRSRATLATWVGDYHRAHDSYRRLAGLGQADAEVDLALARVSAWAGETDDAVAAYRRYLVSRPDAADVWLELARSESWRGNFSAARKALASYRQRFGETPQYTRELAAILANGDRPNRAQQLLSPLLLGAPDDGELHRTQAIAYARQGRAREAYSALDQLRGLGPGTPETHDVERMVRTLLASTAEPRASVYHDSDRLEIRRLAPRTTIAFRSGTVVSAGYERADLEALANSGLEQVDGRLSARFEQLSVGASQKIRRLVVTGSIAEATASSHRLTASSVGVASRVTDTLHLAFERTSGFFVVSPRTVGLGLTVTAHRGQADWSPTFNTRVIAEGSYQELSDGNRRWELTIAPRRSVARTSTFNFDAGLMAYQLHTDRDLESGYYDPRRYEHYAAVFYPYFKIRENIGVAVSAALGAQRDSAASGFHFGGNVTGEATFGIYEPWTVKIGAGITRNQRLESGAFQGFSSSVSLIRHF
jgi:tetratricopeptide (TPR) repeat protein